MNNNRKRKKIEGSYNEKNLIRIEGESMNQDYIYNMYLSLIEDKGFNLTIDGIASFLRCSYHYVAESLLDEIEHIRINDSVRPLLIKVGAEYNADEFLPLFYKRILFKRESFNRFLLENGKYVQTYKRFYKDDFEPAALEKLKAEIQSYNDSQKQKKELTLSVVLQRQMDRFIPISKLNPKYVPIPIVHPLESVPEILYSQKDLVEMNGLNYPVDFYRMVARKGLNKYKIDNLIRYSKEDIEEEVICSMYICLYEKAKDNYGGEAELLNYIVDEAMLRVKD